LYEWQQDVVDAVADDRTSSVLVVGESNAGKTRVLEYIEQQLDAEYVSLRERPSMEELHDRHRGNVLLLDEGGMEPDVNGLVELIRAFDETTVLTTLPEVPSTHLLRSQVDAVVEASTATS
jgi:hypothetical protein